MKHDAKVVLAGLLLITSHALGGTVETCDQYRGVTVGNYVVETDYWNKGQCPGTQCVDIDDQTGSYTVVKATYDCGTAVGGFPCILYGKAFGTTSPHCDLPAKVSSLQCVNSSWTFKPTRTGRWDAAYDIWLCPDNQCGPGGFPGGAEIMVWLDYENTNGWKTDLGPVTINGMKWEVWYWDVDDAGGKRNYVAYLAQTKTDSVKDLDLKKFLDDSRNRGYIQPSWYLYAVFGGLEIASGGVPFTTKSFSVSVNKDCGAKVGLTPLPTPAPTATPKPGAANAAFDEIPPPP